MDKNKYKVLQEMEWRDKTFQPGEIIEDTHNGYIKAMIAQEKLEEIK